MIEDVKKDAAERMGKCVAALKNELKTDAEAKALLSAFRFPFKN